MPHAAIATSPTPRSLLVQWANGESSWVRALVAEILANRQPLSSSRIEHFAKLLLSEKGLADGDTFSMPSLEDGAEGMDRAQALRLTCLRDLANVNALIAGQRVDFSPRMTLLYGENGTGKTGYVRVLKRLASTRTAEDILPNVTAAQPGTPSATVECELDGVAQPPYSWTNEVGVAPFTSIDVFDARSATLLVDDDLMYTYTPSELALFGHVDSAIEGVAKHLTQLQREAVSPVNQFLSRFRKGSSVYPHIETLGAATDMPVLEKQAAITEAEEQSLEPLRGQVAALQSNTLADRLQALQGTSDLLTIAVTIAKTLVALDLRSYTAACNALREARRKHQKASEGAFAGLKLPGILGPEWRAFIEAADAYAEHAHPDGYPAADAACVYCNQTLSAEAAELVRKYRAFCSDEARKDVSAAESRLTVLLQPIRTLNLPQEAHRLQDAAERATRESVKLPVALTQLVAMLPQLLAAATVLSDHAECSADAIPDSLRDVSAGLETTILALAGQVATVREQAKDRTAALQKTRAELMHLEDRVTLRALLQEITAFAARAKWADRLKKVLGTFQGTRKKLTDASKLASEDLLNRDFENLFREECTQLRAPSVELAFPGSRGRPARRKNIGQHRVSAILSEGEQKVIALADFMAEAALRRAATPAVFDDPVNSLDYRRIKDIVRRLAKLSRNRQVVIFTHNVWFAVEMLAAFETTPTECAFYEVESDERGKGTLTKGTHPKVDTIKAMRTRINNTIAEASAASGATRDALVERGYSLMRAFCEKTVEEELLGDIVNRFRLNVMLTKLPSLKIDKMEDGIAALMPIYDKCCEITEAHSSPLETANIQPTLQDLEADWKALQGARTIYV